MQMCRNQIIDFFRLLYFFVFNGASDEAILNVHFCVHISGFSVCFGTNRQTSIMTIFIVDIKKKFPYLRRIMSLQVHCIAIQTPSSGIKSESGKNKISSSQRIIKVHTINIRARAFKSSTFVKGEERP